MQVLLCAGVSALPRGDQCRCWCEQECLHYHGEISVGVAVCRSVFWRSVQVLVCAGASLEISEGCWCVQECLWRSV